MGGTAGNAWDAFKKNPFDPAGLGTKGEMPAPPDFVGMAQEQGAQNLALLNAQTEANRPDVTTPTGGFDWTKDANGNWSLNVNLSPEQQQLLGQQQQIGMGANQAALDRLGQGISGQGVQDALYGQMTSRLDPMWGQKTDQYTTQLYNQGLRPGDSAYDQAMGNFGRDRNDAYQQAMYQAITGGDQSASNQVNMINALRSGGQISMPGQPSFSNAGLGQAPDVTGASNQAYQAALGNWNAQQAQRQGTMMGGLGILAALL